MKLSYTKNILFPLATFFLTTIASTSLAQDEPNSSSSPYGTDDPIQIYEKRKSAIAEMGKNACVNLYRNDQENLAMLFRQGITLGDLCGCVKTDLLVLLVDEQFMKDVMIFNAIQNREEYQLEVDESDIALYEQKKDSITDEFMKILDVATNGCLNKLAKP